MGNTGAKTLSTTEILTKNVSNILARNIMNCSNTTIVSQEINIYGTGNVVKGVKMESFPQIKSNCSISANKLMEMKNSIANDLKDSLKSQSEGIFSALGKSESESNKKIQSIIENNVTEEQITEIVNTSNSIQRLNIVGNSNIVSDIVLKSVSETVSDASQNLSSKIVNELGVENKTKTDLSSANTPLKNLLDGISGIISSIGTVYIVLILIVIGIFIIGPMKIISIFTGSKSGGNENYISSYIGNESN